MDAEFAGFPCEVEGIDGDAVAAEAWAWVEGGEAEGFGFGGVDDFPDVDAHGVGDDFHFVDEADVDGADEVFEEFDHFCDAGGGNGDDLLVDGSVGGEALFETGWGEAADDFGDAGAVEVGVAWVFAFRGEDEEEV